MSITAFAKETGPKSSGGIAQPARKRTCNCRFPRAGHAIQSEYGLRVPISTPLAQGLQDADYLELGLIEEEIDAQMKEIKGWEDWRKGMPEAEREELEEKVLPGKLALLKVRVWIG